LHSLNTARSHTGQWRNVDEEAPMIASVRPEAIVGDADAMSTYVVLSTDEERLLCRRSK
jgi:hypothetical protein